MTYSIELSPHKLILNRAMSNGFELNEVLTLLESKVIKVTDSTKRKDFIKKNEKDFIGVVSGFMYKNNEIQILVLFNSQPFYFIKKSFYSKYKIFSWVE
jgi:hypothetical protein